jgi:hypothetical protein
MNQTMHIQERTQWDALVSLPERKSCTMGKARLGSLQLFLYTHYQFVRQVCTGLVATFGPVRPVTAQRVRKPIWKQHQPATTTSVNE